MLLSLYHCICYFHLWCSEDMATHFPAQSAQCIPLTSPNTVGSQGQVPCEGLMSCHPFLQPLVPAWETQDRNKCINAIWHKQLGSIIAYFVPKCSLWFPKCNRRCLQMTSRVLLYCLSNKYFLHGCLLTQHQWCHATMCGSIILWLLLPTQHIHTHTHTYTQTHTHTHTHTHRHRHKHDAHN